MMLLTASWRASTTVAIPIRLRPQPDPAPTVWLDVLGLGRLSFRLDKINAPHSSAALERLAMKRTRGRVHRAEPPPPLGSFGPPYALVQFRLDDDSGLLATLAHEGTAAIARGALCLIGGSSDLFISLARHGEHGGWDSMTVVGHVAEAGLGSVERRILGLPRHNYTHPNFGTQMSMLDTELSCTLRLPA
jgi:hypothetical protein